MAAEEQKHSITLEELLAAIFAVVLGIVFLFGAERCSPFSMGFFGDGDGDGGAVVADLVPDAVVPEVDGSLDDERRLRADVEAERDALRAQLEEVSNQPVVAVEDRPRQIRPTVTEVDVEETVPVTNLVQQTPPPAVIPAPVAVDTGELDALKNRNADLQSQLEARMKAEAEARQQVGRELDLRKQVEDELKRLQEQRANGASVPIPVAEPPAPRAIPVQPKPRGALVQSADDLEAGARALFTDLRQVHSGAGTLGSQALTDGYKVVSSKHSARMVDRFTFQSGKSGISNADARKLAAAVKDKSGSRYLVVGYASVDGSDAANRKLSESRALSVTKVFRDAGLSNAQALYMGSTKKFSAGNLAPNRAVEVWEITK